MTTVNTAIVLLQAQAVVELLGQGEEPDAYESNASALLQAMGARGDLNPNHAYDFELNPDGRLQVINDTEGFTLLVDPATGAAEPAPEDEVVIATPDPVKYYRILVNRAACPFFRTSRLHNAAAMFDALTHMRFGFSHGEDANQYALSVLSVSASGVGHICGDAELAALADAVQDVA